MTLNIINKNMQVHTKVELEPTINYVSASNDNFLDRLEIDNIGEYGFRSSRAVSLGSAGAEKVFSVNATTYKNFKDALPPEDSNALGVIKTAKLDEENAVSSSNNYFDTNIPEVVREDFTDQQRETLLLLKASTAKSIKKNALSSAGLQRVKVAGDSFKFNVERVKCGYIIDDTSLNKKSSIKNLKSYYSEHIEHNNFYESTWGFKNYNSLNFFNIGPKTNTNFSDSITHKNCIIYPNLSYNNNSKQQYDFKSLKDFTVSFYINPRYKNNTGKHFNPGCILSIPGVLSVFLISGSSVDENGLTDKFRLYIQFGDSTFNNLSVGDFNITNENSQSSNLNYFSKDNILNYNNWHLVNLCYKKNSDKYDFALCIDGKVVGEEYNQVVSIDQTAINNSYIEIGNKHNVTKTNISDFVNKCFSKSLTVQNDNKGPYVNKHIILGNQIDTVLNDVHDTNNTYDLVNSLNEDNSDYISANTSKALSAELADIRFYKQFLDVDKCLEISKKGISSINSEKSAYDLIFYIPCYYYSQDIKKKGLVNLSAPYKAFDFGTTVLGGAAGTGPVVGTAPQSLRGPYLDSDGGEISSERISELEDFEVRLENISYNYPINPVFYTFTGGTDVSVEHFCREFVSSTQPNVVINNNISKDRYADCFLLTPDKILNNPSLNRVVKKGGTADDLLCKIFENTILDNNEINNLANYSHQTNNIIYRNYMILPNDNGIQEQYYTKDNFNYTSNDLYRIHTDRFDDIRLDIVNLDKSDKRFSTSKTKSQRSTILTSNPGERYFDIVSNIGRLLAASSEYNGSQFRLDTEPRFKENSDKLLNISLSNYHSDNNILYVLNEDVESVISISRYRQKYENGIYSGDVMFPSLNSREGFFGSFSNPAQRSYYSNYINAISQNEVYDTKQIGNDESIVYKKINSPLDSIGLGLNNYENISTMHCISTQVFNNSIKRETFEIKDVDLPLSSGIKLTFKDTRLGTLYRADCLTRRAEWGTCGSVLYDEGISMLHHPSVWGLGKTNISIKATSRTSTNIFELNLPAQSGETNQTKNTSKIENLRLDESAFNSDEDFVYITDIDLHDENLNVVASVKLAQPFAKKDSDNVLFRIKMDY